MCSIIWHLEVVRVNDVSIVTFFCALVWVLGVEEMEAGGNKWKVKKANIYFCLVKRRRKKKERRTKIPNPRDWIGCTGARAAVRKQDFKASQSNRRKCRGKQNGGTWWLADRLASMMTNSERHNGDGLSFVAANSIHASFFFPFAALPIFRSRTERGARRKEKGGNDQL